MRTAQSDANFDQETSTLSWRALNSLAKEYGSPAVDYDRFAAQWDAEEQQPPEKQILHRLIQSFDGSGIVLKTQEKEQPMRGKEATGQVEKMAKRATAKAIG